MRVGSKSDADGLNPDLWEGTLGACPTRSQRLRAWWAGRQDGRANVTPDPETGLTPHLERFRALNATHVDSELLRIRPRMQEVETERALHRQALDNASAILAEEQAQTPPEADSATVGRWQRRHGAQIASCAQTIRSCEAEIARLDEDYQHLLDVRRHRIDRVCERHQQLVAIYWRALLRHHGEAEEVRAGHRQPSLTVPAGTFTTHL
ncbi:hypothetical protein [Dietzia sp. SYD-A1]|uniref:hypothetical protein n=1 Tax=Dietzia sp. SYD-A1 TaxID=2780141 RepID=UPI0018916740|nr:hypothetical protein [Dietzia sp. SYD-A1]